MKPLELHPLDTLFFRDARPVEAGAGSGGHGGNWPLPTVAHEALRTALLRLLPAMPAGSVFYFEADSEADAKALVVALHGRTRSDYFGEKGMGLGYCGIWKEQP